MEQERFVKQEAGSFFGDYLFEQVVPKDHFLRQSNAIVDWKRYTKKLIKFYKGQGQYGRPPFDPAVVLKMLLLAYLYNLSERQVDHFWDYEQRDVFSSVPFILLLRTKIQS